MLLCSCENHHESLRLWYDSPSQNWNEALPIGNGHIGAMVFGGVETEQIQFNDNTLYSGEPDIKFDDIKIEPESLNYVIDLMKSKKYDLATDYVCKNWLGRLHQFYQPFGNLFIHNKKKGSVSNYSRELILSEAIVRTNYEKNGVHFTQEVFASHPDSIIVISLECNQKNGLDFIINFDSPHPTAKVEVNDNCLVLKGQAPGYVERRTFEQIESWGDQHKHPELYDERGNRKYNKLVLYEDEINNRGTFFEAKILPVMEDDGKIETVNNGLHIYNTQKVYLLLGLATSFNGYDKSPSREGVNPSKIVADILSNAEKYSLYDLKKRHCSDFRSFFDRVSLHLSSSSEEQKVLPTDKRIVNFSKTTDPELAAILFQYGRYLMISGSRQGGQPLNLQGIWNKDIVPAWNGGYTMNINTEMNYWPAEITGLSECHEPLFRLIKELSETGRCTAKNMYGARGWVAHHNTSIWRESVPNDNVPFASFWPMAQGWLCSHLFEHYLFNQDIDFLRETVYPLMKGASEFFVDWIVEDGNGHLVTPVGVSPENRFITSEDKCTSMSMGPTMDMSIIRETFANTILAAELLDVDETFRNELNEKLARLLPFKINKNGYLQEWMYDFKERDPRHRHLSHLYSLYPGNQITLDKTPELFSAARKSLEYRGDEAEGWSMGWKINCWARLFDGDHAYKIISKLFNPIGFGEGHNGGGLFRNMLDAAIPHVFQIDGNLGYTAGVAEMLLQSHAGFIHLLPALPTVWNQGSVKGLRARGNFEISMNWNHCRLLNAEILSHSGKVCSIRTNVPVVITNKGRLIAKSYPIEVKGFTFYQSNFETVRNAVYHISAKIE